MSNAARRAQKSGLSHKKLSDWVGLSCMWAGPVPPRLKQSYAGSSEVIFLILELNNLRMQVIFSNLLPAVSSPRCEMGSLTSRVSFCFSLRDLLKVL